MKTPRLSSPHRLSRSDDTPQAPKADNDTYARPNKRRPSWFGLGIAALACTSGLRTAQACNGFNQLQKGWMPPPSAWPSPTTYGDIVALLASYNSGPTCFDSYTTGPDYLSTDFSQQSFSCGSTEGLAFCADEGEFGLIGAVTACAPVQHWLSSWPSSQVLQPIDACGVLRAKDCIFFFPNTSEFQSIQDSFTQAYVPTCRGFNPRQHGWTDKHFTWPDPIDVDSITAIADGCSTGPACGSAFNHGYRTFNCSGQVGTILGQADLELALNATQKACPGAWELLPSPPQGQLIPYNQTQVQAAWDVNFFFEASGSSNIDAALLALARKELKVLRRRHDATYMWRTGMVASAAASTSAMLAYGAARGSIVRKLGVGLGMGYSAAAIGVSVGGVILGWPRIDLAGQILSAVGVGAAGCAYLGAFGVLIFRTLMELEQASR